MSALYSIDANHHRSCRALLSCTLSILFYSFCYPTRRTNFSGNPPILRTLPFTHKRDKGHNFRTTSQACGPNTSYIWRLALESQIGQNLEHKQAKNVSNTSIPHTDIWRYNRHQPMPPSPPGKGESKRRIRKSAKWHTQGKHDDKRRAQNTRRKLPFSANSCQNMGMYRYGLTAAPTNTYLCHLMLTHTIISLWNAFSRRFSNVGVAVTCFSLITWWG